MNRRSFLIGAGTALPLLALTPCAFAAEKTAWPIGCFNRAWTNWSYDQALDGIAAAGYRITGLLSTHRGEAFTSSKATPEYLRTLRKRITDRGLSVNMTALRLDLSAGLEEAKTDLRRQLENAATLELQFALTFGVDDPAQFQDFFKLMHEGAAFAAERRVELVMKPHGGASGASDEILRCIKEVGHPNFHIWYDAGNIIYYTGKDPVTELEPIAKMVTGFCAKDCPAPKGEVMSQFGTGKVDFKAVFRKLEAAGFRGPLMVEGVKVGSTPEETTANARANREFIEAALASV